MARKRTGAVGAFTKPRARNKEGHPTYKRTLDERTLQILMTGTFQDTFYCTKREIGEEAVIHFREMCKKDPELFAKMLVYAREKGFMRSAPVTGLVILSQYSPELFETLFTRIMRTPRNLKEFILLIRKGGLRKGLGRSVKRAINSWLANLSEYHAIKYGGSGDGMSWKDIFCLTRPKPADEKQTQLFKYVFGKEKANLEALSQIEHFEALKRAESDGEAIEHIRDGRIPWELASTVYAPEDKTAYWIAIGHQMPYMALLRNLNTLTRHGCLKDKEFSKTVIEKLTNTEAIRRSMQLPFRFKSAFDRFEGTQRIRDAIAKALDISVGNIPEIPGRTCVAIDGSGSMTGRPAEIASIFGAALAKRTEDCVLIIFDTSAKVMKYVRSDSVLSIARSMNFHWGGTDCSAPIRLLMKNKEVIDNFVILTDGEHWHGGYGPDEAWKDYRKKFNGEALAFHINLQPYGDYLASETDKSVHLVQGWSDDVLRYIAYCNSEEDQLEAVKAIEI